MSIAIKGVVAEWAQARSLEEAVEELGKPAILGRQLAGAVRARVAPEHLGNPKAYVYEKGFVHLADAFEPADLEATPHGFCPVPSSNGTLYARASMIAFMGLMELEPVSYGSENDGELFVNLVTMPGEGREAEKSRKSMSGHTDAVSFPTRGLQSTQFPTIAPSPDVVCLAALRNPDQVPTNVMPLKALLTTLAPNMVAELKKPQFVARSQKTFIAGTKRAFGEELVEFDVEILRDTNEGTWIRHSHSSVDSTDDTGGAAAINALTAACPNVAVSIALSPGDVLIVSNRTALHGRAEVGGDPGGASRWLLRGYALDTTELALVQRHAHSPHMLFP